MVCCLLLTSHEPRLGKPQPMLLRGPAMKLANERDGRYRRIRPDKPATTIKAHRLVAAVIPADVGPLRPIGRPYPAPAAVIVAVVGIGEGKANERKAVEAV